MAFECLIGGSGAVPTTRTAALSTDVPPMPEHRAPSSNPPGADSASPFEVMLSRALKVERLARGESPLMGGFSLRGTACLA